MRFQHKGNAMKKMLSIVVLGAVLATGHAMAGKNVEPVESEVVPVATPIGLYAAIGANWTGYSRDCPCDGKRKKDSTFGETLRLGWDFNPFFGIEARYLRNDFGINFAKVQHYGIYLKPQYHVTDLMNVYALVGYGHTSITCQSKGKKLGGNDQAFNSISLGAGIEYDLSGDRGIQGDEEEGWGLFADVQYLPMKNKANNPRVTMISAGITYDF